MQWLTSLYVLIQDFYLRLRKTLSSYGFPFNWSLSSDSPLMSESVRDTLMVSNSTKNFVILTLYPCSLDFVLGKTYISMCETITRIVSSSPHVYILVNIVGKSFENKELHSSLPSAEKLTCLTLPTYLSTLSSFIETFKKKYSLFKIDHICIKLFIPLTSSNTL